MTPGRHYWRVERDFSNLMDVLDEIDADPVGTASIVAAALKNARETYTFERIVEVGVRLISERKENK